MVKCIRCAVPKLQDPASNGLLMLSKTFRFQEVVTTASSAGATWLSVLSILILCVAPARFLNQDKKSGGRVNKYKKNIL